MIEKDITGNLQLVITDTKQNVTLINCGVFIDGVAVLQGDLGAAEIFPELEVHHAGHSVSAVRRRGPILQDFNALDRRQWNGKQVLERGGAILTHRVGSDTP